MPVGVSAMTDDALLIIEIQQRASQALRLPEDLDLMTGNPSNASIFVMMLSMPLLIEVHRWLPNCERCADRSACSAVPHP